MAVQDKSAPVSQVLQIFDALSRTPVTPLRCRHHGTTAPMQFLPRFFKSLYAGRRKQKASVSTSH